MESLPQTVSKHFDFLVIRAGSGGLGAGRRAAMFGKTVGLIENKVIGGTCVNVGCVPKKIMFNLASFIEETHLFADYGVKGTEQLELDFPSFKKNRDAYIKRLNGIYHKNVDNSGVDFIEGTARFVEAKKVEVTKDGSKTLYSADHVMIAAGSKPIIEKTGIEGQEHCMTSDDIFELETLPKSMIVVGGGYIGVEMVQIMHAFGVKCSLLVRESLLGRVDQEIVDLLIENMKKSGLDVQLGVKINKVIKNPETQQLQAHLSNGAVMETEGILLALGRNPNVHELGCREVGIELESNGAVKVDDYQNTNIPGVYAIGDVTNNIQLTPVAIKAGRIVAERLFNGRSDLKMNYKNIPTVIFSHPPIASVGLTEGQAIKKFGQDKVNVYRSKFVNMFYSLAKDDSKKMGTLFKLICHVEEQGDERLVGCHCHGKGVDEMMQLVGVLLNMGATKKDFDRTVAIHPTASEEFVLMDPKLYE